jgi:hypothetical protein
MGWRDSTIHIKVFNAERLLFARVAALQRAAAFADAVALAVANNRPDDNINEAASDAASDDTAHCRN